MAHARVEELSDSDPEIDDPSSYLPSDDMSIIAPVDISSNSMRFTPQSASQAEAQARARAQGQFSHPSPPSPAAGYQPTPLRPAAPSAPKPDRSHIKAYQTLYPVYFDSARTRAQGRRVSAVLATPNPLARTLLDAVQASLGGHALQLAFEPDKLHPKDWANPGRVRVQLYPKDGPRQSLHPTIKNKAHLYVLVARYLQAHPTQATEPLRLPIEGLPVPTREAAQNGELKPAVPRGWKIGEILPLHSPAVSGGGVSENFFKDMLAEMQKEGGGAAGGPAGLAGNNPMASLMGGMGGGGGGLPAGGSASGGEGNKKPKKEKRKG